MKKLLTLTLTLFCFNAYSLDEVCSHGLQTYKEGEKTAIPEYCFQSMLIEADQKSSLSLENGHKIFAYDNTLIFLEDGKREITAGDQTGFEFIEAIAYDNKSSEVLVFDSLKGSIHFFPKFMKGNISAFRTIKDEVLRGATDIAISEKHNEYLVLINEESKICFFDRDHNSMVHKTKSFTRCQEVPTGDYKSISTGEDTIVISSEQKHIVLNYNNPLSIVKSSDNTSKSLRILWQDKDYFELSNLKELILNKNL